MIWTTHLLGLTYACLRPGEAAAIIAARDPAAPFRYVVTPNADHLVRLHRRPALAPAYQGAWLRLLDSRIVAAAARVLGLRPPPVCPGSDLTLALLQRLRPEDRVTVIGASRQVLLSLPPARIAHYSPPFGFERNPAALARAVAFVVQHPARYVLIAVGSPRQEILAQAIKATGAACGTGLCIGASLSFASGEQRRAPWWMRRSGLEWLHRLLREPRRLARRYLLDSPPIFGLLLRERLGRR
jgi:exopolysaccharide biosynthesis WecB/TagA/CpsF family protein